MTSIFNKIRIILWFPRKGRYSSVKEGEFVSSPLAGGNYVYRGRTLTVDEFHRLPPDFFAEGRYSSIPRVKLVEADPQPVVEEPKAPEPLESAEEESEEPGAPGPEADDRPTLADMTEEEVEAVLSTCRTKGEVEEAASLANISLDGCKTRADIENRIYDTLFPATVE